MEISLNGSMHLRHTNYVSTIIIPEQCWHKGDWWLVVLRFLSLGTDVRGCRQVSPGYRSRAASSDSPLLLASLITRSRSSKSHEIKSPPKLKTLIIFNTKINQITVSGTNYAQNYAGIIGKALVMKEGWHLEYATSTQGTHVFCSGLHGLWEYIDVTSQ